MEENTGFICPICDEPLGSSVEDIPDKCPICDTRKYELLQELEEETGNFAPSAHTGAVAVGNNTEQDQRQSELQSQLIVEEVTARHDFSSVESEASFEEKGVIFSDQISEDVIFENGVSEDGLTANIEEAKEEIVDSQAAIDPKDIVAEAPFVPMPGLPKHKFHRSGASRLETLPNGFKYCPVCKEGYPFDFEKSVCCYCDQRPLLVEKNKGFAPGHYLVLYNDQKKAIAYFRFDRAGSVIVGRSSERNSPNDIDIALAWKNYYQKFCKIPEEYQEKMRLLKGISRKHALIRYMSAEKKYVLFHLSDKNFTVIQLASGEKRTKPPRNRTRMDLLPGTVISMGNQQDFIIFRYKVIAAPGD